MKRSKFNSVGIWIFVASLILGACSEKPQTFSELLVSLKDQPGPQAELRLRDFAQRHLFPFVEDSTVYFLFEDTTRVPVFLAGDFTDWRPDSIELKPIANTSFYYTKATFPSNARLEYKFVSGKNWMLDPFNPYKEEDGYGFNSVLMMPEYVFPKETLLNLKYRVSEMDTLEFKSRLLHNRRRVTVYRHPSAGKQAPLFIFNDGSDYLRFARVRIILDNLIGSGYLQPINALFVDPVQRNKEYWLNERYLKMVFTELVPFAEQRYALKPKSIAFGGASLGGTTALFALKNYGQKIDFVFCQSAALGIEKSRLLRVLQTVPHIKAKIYLSYGSFEGKQMRRNYQKLKSILINKKTKFTIQCFPQGHNWGNWRDHLKNALMFRGQPE